MSVDDSGLYERLHGSEKRRKVAAILLDFQRDLMLEHKVNNEGKPGEDWVSIELILGWTNTIVHALAGDFEYVKATIPPGHDLMARIQVVLGE